MNRRTDYGGLDAFRIIAAALVVAIHTSPLGSFSDGADFFLTRVLARVAVPFFFMVTGQFVLSDVIYGDRASSKRFWRYLRKVLVLYGVSILLYLPLGIYAGHYKELTVAGALKLLVFDGTFYHLWYFPACIIGGLLVYLISRWKNLYATAAVTGTLYLLGLLGDSYFGLTEQIPGLAQAYRSGFQLWSYTRNGLFFAPLFLLLGAVIGTRKPRLRRGWALAGTVVSLSLMTAEAFLLRAAQWQRHDSMYLLLVPAMVFLYQLLLSCRWKPLPLCRKAATWIYILHPMVIVLVRGAAKLLHLPALVDNSLLHYGVVVVVSSVTAFLLALVGRAIPQPAAKRHPPKPSSCRAWIELDLDALEHNVRFLQSKLPETCALMPAVKADAYGHGAVLVAKELERLKVRAFCVACVREGIELRRAGVKGEILILGYTHPAQFDLLRSYRLTQTVVDYAYAQELRRYGKPLHVHIGVDTGMHRLGVPSGQVNQICKIFRMENLTVDGMFTHLSASDSMEPAERRFTEEQAWAFYGLVEELEQRGIRCPRLHLQASYGVLNHPELAGDYARVGIALYGVLSTGADTAERRDQLMPVLSLKARVASVRSIDAGDPAGYGLDFAAPHPMKIAALSIGYADGLPRQLSNGAGAALIAGKRAPIVGRVCMDQVLVDVSDIPEVRSGDAAVLIGRSGAEEITACDLAGQAGTITNDLLSRLGPRLERFAV